MFFINHWNLNTHPGRIKINAAEGLYLYHIIMRYDVKCPAIHRDLVPHPPLNHNHSVWQ